MANEEPVLQLWGNVGRTGDPLSVAPDDDRNWALPTPFRTLAAVNGSPYTAELYTGADALGEPVKTLGTGEVALFPLGHDVGSVRFIQD
ncbi:hypothetical protein ACFV6D_38420 [Kitasatospora sp. NPDC059812]|uniref:hypothetical protein n=1 Tax=Kitasatospora sp. NPDC059812 TaxID=3346958 RepID=UPI0036592DEE